MIGGDKDAVDRLDPIFSALAPGRGRHRGHARPQRPRSACRARLHALRSKRRRAFRQDDPQRHRVRPHAGLCRGVQHPARRRLRRIAGGPALSARSARHRRGLAPRQRHRLLAPRPHRHGVGGRPEALAYSGFVEDSGEGRWTIKAAIEEAVPADVLSAALYARFRSREKESFSDKLLSAMRNKFGGHVEPKADK